MLVVLEHDRCALLHGDSAQLGEVLEPNSVHAMVTDPPAGIAFMGADWDKDKGGRDAWIAWLAELLKPSFAALKPGAYSLVWALPRTSHWTAMALELAGFEIRDVHHHIFGTGFPKSLNISKAIDSHLGAERAVLGPNPNGRPNMVRVDATVLSPRVDAPLTAPGSPEAEQWEGFGTALKPAVEHWILARKPIEGTYAENVLAHGAGALNIDACRVGTEARINAPAGNKPGGIAYNMSAVGMPEDAEARGAVGRWPAHLSLEHAPGCMVGSDPGERVGAPVDFHTGCVEGCPVRLLDEQSAAGGMHSAGNARDGSTAVVGESYNATSYELPPNRNMRRLGDKGGASRFFYVAKAARSEKDAGLDHLTPKTGGEATGREDNSIGTQNPRAGAGRTGGARNFHPTVKNIALMEWLIKLITPPGGTVLDPFAGSGTTGIAALGLGMSFVGCELTDEYVPILVGRIKHALSLK